MLQNVLVLLRLVRALMPLGNTKEMAGAAARNDLAAYAYFEPPTERERLVLIGSAKMDASVCKTLGIACFPAVAFKARVTDWRQPGHNYNCAGRYSYRTRLFGRLGSPDKLICLVEQPPGR